MPLELIDVTDSYIFPVGNIITDSYIFPVGNIIM